MEDLAIAMPQNKVELLFLQEELGPSNIRM